MKWINQQQKIFHNFFLKILQKPSFNVALKDQGLLCDDQTLPVDCYIWTQQNQVNIDSKL